MAGTRIKARPTYLARATAVLNRFPIIDGHNDLPWVIRNDPTAKGDVAAYKLTRERNDGDTDIPRMRRGKVAGQVWAAYVPTDIPHPARATLEQIDIILQIERTHPDVFLPARRVDDVMKARRMGKIASIVAVEGGVGLENSLAPLRIWHAAGARLMTLCHNGTLDWIDSATDDPRHHGLTDFGRAVVRELNRLGMMVDCAHVSPDVMHQVLDTSTAPIVFSHSNARALCDHVRNVPDSVLERLPANDGIVMATFIPDFLNEDTRKWMMPLRDKLKLNPTAGRNKLIAAHERTHGKCPPATLQDVATHIEYLAGKVGPTRVGIGSDFFGSPVTPEGLENVSRFPHLIAEMLRRGWSDRHAAGLAGRNFMRVFGAVEREGQRLRASGAPFPVSTA